jgi:hypothetical protein
MSSAAGRTSSWGLLSTSAGTDALNIVTESVMKSLRAILSIGAVVATTSVAPALAEWSEANRQLFLNTCLSSCPKGGDAKLAAFCERYCPCATRDIERAIPDADDFSRRFEAQEPAFMRQLRDIAEACARKR